MMGLKKSLLQSMLMLFGLSLLCFVAGVFLLNRSHQAELTALQERINHSDQERLQFMVAGRGLDVLKPAAKSMADLISSRTGSLQEQVKEVASLVDPASRLNLVKKQDAFMAIAQKKQQLWSSLLLLNDKGVVLGAWPDKSLNSKDYKDLPEFKLLAPQPDAVGNAFIFDIAPNPASKKPEMVLVAGVGQPKTNKFGGMLEARLPVSSLLDLGPSGPVRGLANASKGSLFFLLRGSGKVFFCQPREDKEFKEDFSKIDQSFRDVLKKMQEQENGSSPISYDGKPGIMVWARMLPWDASQGPDALQVMAGFLPLADFANQNPPSVASGRSFFTNPLLLLLFAFSFLLPLILSGALLGKTLRPLEITAESIRALEEGNLEVGFPEEKVYEFARLHEGFNLLINRVKASDEKVKQLNESLLRLEAQSNEDAAQAAKDLSELRGKLTSFEMEKNAATAKLGALEASKAELSNQIEASKGALAAAQKSLEQKTQQNASLSAQLQEQMKTLEDLKLQMKSLEEKAVKRDSEKVRLDATNTLSSELKATISVIKSYISSILGTSGSISGAQQEFLGVVINKSARLERLINDLVDLSQIESGLKPLQISQVNLSNVINEIILNAQVQADNKKISLDFASSSANPTAQVDSEKVASVVQTLLSQAIKVTSRNEKISILLSERDVWIEIRISDPGMSLPPDRAAKVFGQFHGVDSQAGPEFIGTGLRFPILKSVVESMGGKVWIESQVGKGKTFIVSLPKVGNAAAKTSSAGGPAPAAPRPAAGSLPPLVSPGAQAIPAPAGPQAGPGGLPPLGSLGTPAGSGAALPPLGSLPPLGAPAAAKPSGPEGPKPLPGLGSLPPLASPNPPAASAGLPPLGSPNPPAGPGGLPPLGSPNPPAAAKPSPSLSKDDIANFASIFGDSKPGAPAAGPSSLPPLGTPNPPVAKPAAPAPAAPGKPGPSLSKEDISNFANIFGDSKPAAAPTGTPNPPAAAPKPPMGAPNPPAAGLPPLGSLNPPAPAGVGKPGPNLSQDDIANFANIFGDAKKPAPTSGTPNPPAGVVSPLGAPNPPAGGLPPLGAPNPPAPAAGKPAPSLSKDDIANFASIFGDKKAPAPSGTPNPLSAVAPAGTPNPPAKPPLNKDDFANFDQIFGSKAPAAPAGPSPNPASPAAPAPLAPPPAPAAAKPGTPLNKEDVANFEAIFGNAPKSPVAPLGGADAAPKPAAPAPLAPPNPAKPGGLGSLGDLTKMIQNAAAKPNPPKLESSKDDIIE